MTLTLDLAKNCSNLLHWKVSRKKINTRGDSFQMNPWLLHQFCWTYRLQTMLSVQMRMNESRRAWISAETFLLYFLDLKWNRIFVTIRNEMATNLLVILLQSRSAFELKCFFQRDGPFASVYATTSYNRSYTIWWSYIAQCINFPFVEWFRVINKISWNSGLVMWWNNKWKQKQRMKQTIPCSQYALIQWFYSVCVEWMK